MTRKSGTLALTLFAAATSMVFASLAQAGSAPPKVNSFYGAFNQDVPIQVPGFRGLEPGLQLHYDSTGGNGWLGVGWRLNGISVIERAGPHGGSPTYSTGSVCQTCYDTCRITIMGISIPVPCNPHSCCVTVQDSYRLDGQELVPDTSLGGTHSTKVQSYRRVVWNETADEWYVYNKDGVKFTYRPVHSVTGGTFRWGLKEIRDVSGVNVVTITWASNLYGSTWSYPSQIAYNSNTILFHWEARTDVSQRPVGGSFESMYGRLKTIEVKVGSTRARAYKLSYTYSTASNRSLLASVQLFGKNATISSGTVTGGMSLPATSFQYQGGATGFNNAVNFGTSSLFGNAVGGRPRYAKGQYSDLVDMNGDGIADYVSYYRWTAPAAYGLWVALGTGAGYGTPTNWNSSALLCNAVHGRPSYQGDGNTYSKLIDMNRDGRADYVSYYNHCTSKYGLWVLINNGHGFDPPVNWNTSTLLGTNGDGYPGWGNSNYTDLLDVNGDGLPDFVAHRNYSTSQFGMWVLLNTGTGFSSPVNWGTRDALCHDVHARPSYAGDNVASQLIDMTGDGLLDYVSYHNHCTGTPGLWVLVNVGNGFLPPANWNSYGLLGSRQAGQGYPGWGNTNYSDLVDMNGDGYPDYVTYHNYTNSTFGLWVLLNNGKGFAAPVNWGTRAALCNDVHARPSYLGSNLASTLMDINHDGRPDYVSYYNHCTSQYGMWVLINTGNGFKSPANWGTFSKLGSNQGGSGYPGWERGDYTHIQDIDGDGKPDFLAHHNYAVGQAGMWVLKNNGKTPDLMTKVTNEMGASTSVVYAPYSSQEEGYLPPGMVLDTVESTTTTDGRGGSTKVSYTYSGANYDKVDRRFLGFRYSKQTMPCITGESKCPYQETWFKQDYGSVSKPERVDLLDGDGHLYSSIIQEYTTNGDTVPYTSLSTGTWAYAYDGSGSSCPTSWTQGYVCAYGRRTFTDRCATRDSSGKCTVPSYDAYGNQLREISYGDYDLGGDEKTTENVFVPNSDNYIVGLPAVKRLFDGAGTSGLLLEEAQAIYDANTEWNKKPTVGRAAKARRLASLTPSYQETSQLYDTYGNVTAQVGPTGHRTEYVMDSAYHLFRTETRDALYFASPADPRHRVLKQIDPVCGAETYALAMSGLETWRTHDDLCRLTQISDSTGYFENHTYVNLGTATTQYTQVEVPGADGTGNHWTRKYLDGLGRTYKTMQKGPSVGKDIITETTFNARGGVETKTAAYYTGETKKSATASYDALDRVTRVLNPDNSISTATYGLGVTTTIDEALVKREEFSNALGQVTKRREWLSGVAVDTSFSYNAHGQATQITDPKGNVYRVTYNLLGQKASYVDPDRGSTYYGYDVGGQLVSITYPLGRTEYSYDAIGRKTKQIERKPDGTIEQTLTWKFDEARTGYYNVSGLTTMTDALGTATLNYDQKGHLAQATRVLDGTAYTYSHSYDVGGRLLSTRLPDGEEVGTRTYDGAGRPKSIPGYVTAATYAASGKLLTLTRANGTVTTYAYNANRGWLTDIDTLKGSTVIQNLHYNRDPVGRVTQVTSPFADEGWTYTYNDLGFLRTATGASSATTQSWDYDTVGNITRVTRPGGSSLTYTYESAHGPSSIRPHAVKQMGSNQYSYDAAGNMVSGPGRTITWGVNGLPKTIGNESYAYDGNNARARRTVGAITTYYVSDEYEVTGTTVTKYFSFATELVAKKVGTTNYWLHADGLGSIQAVTNASGVEVQRFKHRPYGERLSNSTSHVEPHGFTGQRHDDSGLVYLNARYYDPLLGRFISADPTVPSAASIGLNRYAYAGNDPVNNVDVNGLGFWKKLKKFFKKVWKGIKDAIKAIYCTLKAAVQGDWKAIASIIIMVLAIWVGGIVMQAALKSVVAGAAASFEAGASAMAVVLEAGNFAAAAATYVGVSAGIGAASAFSIAYIQTGSLSAALKAGVNGAISGALNACLNIAMSKWLGIPRDNEAMDKAGAKDSDFSYQWGRAGPSGEGPIAGIKNETLGIDWTWDMGRGSTSAIKGHYGQWASHAIAPLHDRWGAINLLEGLRSSKSLIVRDIYAIANMIEAAAWQGVAEGAVAGAFGKVGPTTAAILYPQTAAATFFTMPKFPYPGVSREDIAKAAIKIKF